VESRDVCDHSAQSLLYLRHFVPARYISVQTVAVDQGQRESIQRYITTQSSGLVVRVPGYRSRSPGSILDATTFSEK
jgi:hypothetical protein